GGGLAAPAVGFDVEYELLALYKAAHSGALYGRNMNEHVRAATILRDEAEALLRVEELHGTCSHIGLLETHQFIFRPHNHLHGPPSGFGVFSRKGPHRAGRQSGKIPNCLLIGYFDRRATSDRPFDEARSRTASATLAKSPCIRSGLAHKG